MDLPGATTGRIQDMVSPEPSLHLSDQALWILELGKAVRQSKQHFSCPQLRRGRGQELAQSNGPNWNRVAYIQADTTAQQTQMVAPLNQTGKQTCQLSLSHQKIIWPFDTNGHSGMLQALSQRQSKRQTQQTGTGVRVII
tara:strand:- start:86 stop:505 length:420 start_codon:yes stop_codon:yes gene_type:complete